jgi:hypothetical protein
MLSNALGRKVSAGAGERPNINLTFDPRVARSIALEG